MARDVTPLRSRAPAKPHCPDNDCQRQQAEALTRIADVGEQTLAHFVEMKPHLVAIGEVVGKWLKFCAFTRKWFPRVGWWLLPIAVTLLTKGSGEAADALISALTAFLQAQAGAAG